MFCNDAMSECPGKYLDVLRVLSIGPPVAVLYESPKLNRLISKSFVLGEPVQCRVNNRMSEKSSLAGLHSVGGSLDLVRVTS